jgi:hypothetical protein
MSVTAIRTMMSDLISEVSAALDRGGLSNDVASGLIGLRSQARVVLQDIKRDRETPELRRLAPEGARVVPHSRKMGA